MSDINVNSFSLIYLFFYIFQYVKLPYINYLNKNGFRCNKISQFSTIILNKNTHKIIILGIYIFGALSLILLKFYSNAEKAVFAEVGAVHSYQICKKMKKFDRELYSLKIEKIRFFCDRLVLCNRAL